MSQAYFLGIPFSNYFEKTVRLGFFALSLVSFAECSSVTIPAGSCSDLTCDHFCGLYGAIDTFTGQVHRISAAVYNKSDIVGDPLNGEAEASVLGLIKVSEPGSVQNEETYHPYFCAMSQDWTRGVMVYSVQEQEGVAYHPLVLTVQEGIIRGIHDVNTNKDDLHKELQGVKVARVRLPLSMVIGDPERHFSLDEEGALTIQNETILDDLRDLSKAVQTLSTENLQTLREGIASDTEQALETANTPIKTDLAALSTAISTLITESGTNISGLEAEIKKVISDDGSTTRTALETTQSALKKTIKKQVQASTDATKGTVELEAAGIKSAVNTDIQSAQKAITDHITQQLSQWQNKLDGVNKDQNLSLAGNLVNAVRSGYQDAVDKTAGYVKASEKRLDAHLQALTGVELDSNGQPKGGTLLQKQERVLDAIMTHTLQTPEIYQTLSTLTQVLQEYGLLPIQYLGSIQTMLYGHSQFSRSVLVGDSILQLLREIPTLLDNVELGDYKEKFEIPSKNIRILANFMETTDVLTINALLPLYIKLFGPKIPVFDISGYNVNQYCQFAHFCAEDFGLYAWVKEIHSLLKEFKRLSEVFAVLKGSAPQDDILSQTLASQDKAVQVICSCGHTCNCETGASDGGTGDLGGTQIDLDQKFSQEVVAPTRDRLAELLAGIVDKKQVIPSHQFNGLMNYPEILQDCIEVLRQVRRYSPLVQLEKKVDILAKAVQTLQSSLEHQIAHLTAVFETATRAFMPLPLPHHHHCHCPKPGEEGETQGGGTETPKDDSTGTEP